MHLFQNNTHCLILTFLGLCQLTLFHLIYPALYCTAAKCSCHLVRFGLLSIEKDTASLVNIDSKGSLRYTPNMQTKNPAYG